MQYRLTVLALLATLTCLGGTNQVSSTNLSDKPGQDPAAAQAARKALAQRAEQLRLEGIQGRRYICGRVMGVLPDGLVVDSGYTTLLNPPFNHSWLVHGNVSVSKSPSLIEEKKPDAVCVGLVFLGNIPKRPAVKPYDYVVLHGYPMGEKVYTPVPGVSKKLRRFSASLERAVNTNLAADEK